MHHRHVLVHVCTISIGTLAPSGYGYVNQIKSTTCIEKIKKIQIQGNVQKNLFQYLLYFLSILHLQCLLAPSVSLFGGHSTTKYPYPQPSSLPPIPSLVYATVQHSICQHCQLLLQHRNPKLQAQLTNTTKGIGTLL